MKSGMLAAEAAFAAIAKDRTSDVLDDYETNLRSSWIATELQLVKNVEPLLAKFGNTIGTLLAGIDMWMRTLKIGLPFTMKHKPDCEKLWRKDVSRKIDYPKPDGVISFDRLSSVFLSNTNHEEDQPVHLQLKDPSVPISYNLPLYDEPAQRYCPAGVYEVVGLDEGNPRFQINAQNCVHCKTCDIKDPTQNINWVVPEGGGGPNYPNM
jgi:electron-transferring-flavoprotein dehydrogenase